MSRLLSFPAACGCLGVEERYLRRLVSEGRIGYLKDRRRLFFTPEDLDAYVAGLTRVEPQAQDELTDRRSRRAVP